MPPANSTSTATIAISVHGVWRWLTIDLPGLRVGGRPAEPGRDEVGGRPLPTGRAPAFFAGDFFAGALGCLRCAMSSWVTLTWCDPFGRGHSRWRRCDPPLDGPRPGKPGHRPPLRLRSDSG